MILIILSAKVRRTSPLRRLTELTLLGEEEL
jgi:hypothetical protein